MKQMMLPMVGVIMMMMQQLVSSALLDRHSFGKPFDEINADGVRQLSPQYNFGGHTVVNKHFIRLTSDRQNKRGYLYGTQVLPSTDISMIFTFRISGQGTKWFGDGLALWLTSQAEHEDGENHGFMEEFTGMGIVFDTFVNEDHRGGHKDVSIIVNQGQSGMPWLDKRRIGCNVEGMRYAESNDAFNPAVNASRAKIQIQQDMVSVHMDPLNRGEWTECIKLKIPLGKDWLKSAYLGVTASTGALADNHDVIALSVYDQTDDELHEEVDQSVKDNAEVKSVDMAAPLDERTKALQKQLELMVENSEHKLEALREAMENTIQKLREQEEEDEKRIEELEEIVGGRISERFNEEMDNFHNTVDEKLEETVEKSSSKTGAWKMPFLILVVVVGGGAYMMHKKYQELRKSHLL